jgi:hypothetical protein
MGKAEAVGNFMDGFNGIGVVFAVGPRNGKTVMPVSPLGFSVIQA